MRKTISVTIIMVLALWLTTAVAFADSYNRSYLVATPTDEPPPPEPTPEAGQLFNRSAAATYANTWAHGRNPNYPDFGGQCGCATDCTNYASQVLHEGGYPLHPTDPATWYPLNPIQWWYGQNYPFGWWNTNSWSVPDALREYVTHYPSDFQFKSSPVAGTNLTKGDFFLMDLDRDGTPDHTRVIVGSGYTSTKPADYTYTGCISGGVAPIPARKMALLANQHCVDRWHVVWNYNLPNGTKMWAYHVKW